MAGTEHKVSRLCIKVWQCDSCMCYGSCGQSPQVEVGAKLELYRLWIGLVPWTDSWTEFWNDVELEVLSDCSVLSSLIML